MTDPTLALRPLGEDLLLGLPSMEGLEISQRNAGGQAGGFLVDPDEDAIFNLCERPEGPPTWTYAPSGCGSLTP